MVVSVQIAPPDFDRMFGALADHTRRDLVRRAIGAEEGVVELGTQREGNRDHEADDHHAGLR